MTEVIFTTNTDHKIIGFECIGHAGFARKGKDLVCAGISVLMINTINTLTEIVQAKVKLESEEKNAYSKCFLSQLPDEKTELVMRSFELGIKGISESYGSKYCKVTYKED